MVSISSLVAIPNVDFLLAEMCDKKQEGNRVFSRNQEWKVGGVGGE